MITCDVLVVGAGLTGASAARVLADKGLKVVVIDKRPHLAGNCFDYAHPCGLMVNSYGPHYFRTNSDKVWSFVCRFAKWRPWAAEVQSLVKDKLVPWPPSVQWCIDQGIPLTPLLATFSAPTNFEQQCLSRMPVEVYDKLVAGYTQKQWGVKPKELSPKLAERFSLRIGDDRRLRLDKHQALPAGGYTAFVAEMLRGIRCFLSRDYFKEREGFKAGVILFTGSIDEYYGYRFGPLRYRSQSRVSYWSEQDAPRWPVVQVNFPSLRDQHIREIEWLHMAEPAQRAKLTGTLITREMPGDDDRAIIDREYPFPDEANHARYMKYRELAELEHDVWFGGRLGRYIYLDMDQAIGQGMMIGESIATKGESEASA